MRYALFNDNQLAQIDRLDASTKLASAQNRLAQIGGEAERLSHRMNELQQALEQYRSQRHEVLNHGPSDVVRQPAIVDERISDIRSRI